MQSVFAESSSHGHAAQVQQGPGDTWTPGGWGEKERQRWGINSPPNSEDPRPAVTDRHNSTEALCQLPGFRAEREPC